MGLTVGPLMAILIGLGWMIPSLSTNDDNGEFTNDFGVTAPMLISYIVS